MIYSGDVLKIRENTLYLCYTTEAEFYFEHEGGEEYWEDYDITAEDAQEWRDFKAEFDVVTPDALESEDFYRGTNHMFVIKRKADGALFGMSYFYEGGKYGESHFIEESDGEFYELLPVRSYCIVGYEYGKVK